jgi:hypothetical protein
LLTLFLLGHRRDVAEAHPLGNTTSEYATALEMVMQVTLRIQGV